MITFRVYGLPVAQGSMRMRTHEGRSFVTHDSDRLGVWRETVAASARKVGVDQVTIGQTMGVGLMVSCDFWLPRPKTVKSRLPTTGLDLDKCLRAIFDALTTIAWANDAQVTDLGRTRKRYAKPGEPPGVSITIAPAPEDGE